MSLARQHVIRGPSFIGAGYFPSRMPCHQLDAEIGRIFNTLGRRSKATFSKLIFSVVFII
jgi:hypothetical protein